MSRTPIRKPQARNPKVRRPEIPPFEASFVITVHAKPRSSVSALEPQGAPGTWVARLRSSPVDGKANAELVELVARHFGCTRSCVSVISGATARLKLVRIHGGTQPSAGLDETPPSSARPPD